jgi:hypothetical protein
VHHDLAGSGMGIATGLVAKESRYNNEGRIRMGLKSSNLKDDKKFRRFT